MNAPPPSATRWAMRLPAATGTVPAGAPAPGRYSIRLEFTTSDGGAAIRTAAAPLSIAAGVSPADGPLLRAADSYTVHGTGFVLGDMQVLLGAIPLRPAGTAAPSAGEYAVDPAGTALTFAPPAGLRPGTYQVRVRVAGVESDPALWLEAT